MMGIQWILFILGSNKKLILKMYIFKFNNYRLFINKQYDCIFIYNEFLEK